MRPLGGDDDPLAGREIDGRYRLLSLLGVGGMGFVYLAEQVGLGRRVAVKMLFAERARDEAAVRRFAREARTLASVDHPGIVRVLDYGSGEHPYIAMELVQGPSLQRIVDGTGAPAKGTVLAIWQNAGNGLYAQQDPSQAPTNYHARLAVAEDGTFAFTTVRPVSYKVPDDGPAGDMLRVLGRDAWRPAHLHMIIQAPGHAPLITEFFPEDDEHLDGDAVFGVRAGLVLPFAKLTDRAALPANLAARDTLPLPVWSTRLDLTLPAG